LGQRWATAQAETRENKLNGGNYFMATKKKAAKKKKH
jgi:hypothetical protein